MFRSLKRTGIASASEAPPGGGLLVRKSRALAAVAAVAGVVGFGAVAAPAGASTAATTGSVSGVVKNAATGKPVAGVCVNVVQSSDNTTVGTSKPSSKTGAWKLAGVAPATGYTAISTDCTSGTNYVGQWYKNQDFQADATMFAVKAGKVTKKINFSLSEGGYVSGTVTDSSTGDPVQDVLVVALWTTADQASAYSVCTSSTGAYKLSAVPTSGAIVWFDTGTEACGASTPYNQEYYLNSATYGSATVVGVKAGKVTRGIDQALTPSS